MNLHAVAAPIGDDLWEQLHHLPYQRGFDELKRRVAFMESGRTLSISVPDFAMAVDRYLRRDGVLPTIVDVHQPQSPAPAAWYDVRTLAQIMRQSGLIDIRRFRRDADNLYLHLVGTKPVNATLHDETAAPLTVSALLSLPRYGQNSFWCMAMEALMPLGIPLRDYQGPFWGQGVQTLISSILAQDQVPDVILALDYDTPPRTADILALMRVLLEHPETDAVIPLQSSRHDDKCLFSIDLPVGCDTLDSIPQSVFDHPLTPAIRGHFGCTLIRTRVFEKMPKPWFLAVPNEDGDWGEGRIDSDAYFWKKFCDSGLKLTLANRIRVGHVVEMVKIPGPDFRPVYITPDDYRSGKYPHALD